MGPTRIGTKRWLPLFVALAVVLTLISWPTPARAAISRTSFESCLLDGVNEARAAAGRAPLQMAQDLVGDVRDWSKWMSDHQDLAHMPSSRRDQILPDSTIAWGENVAWHSNSNLPDCDAIHDMWMNSTGHRNNILNPSFRFVAIGTHVGASGWWATQLFFDANGYAESCDGRFCDDDGSVFEGAIEAIADEGITLGCNPPANDRYCPDEPVTRGAMAAFLSRALGLPNGPSTDFVDDNGSVFESSIEQLASAGITNGCNPPTNDRFCPDEFVTRGQMAAFLERGLSLPPSFQFDFVDDDGSPFETSIQAIAADGITVGCNPPSNDHFCPDEFVTRGQMAAFLARALDL